MLKAHDLEATQECVVKVQQHWHHWGTTWHYLVRNEDLSGFNPTPPEEETVF